MNAEGESMQQIYMAEGRVMLIEERHTCAETM